MAGSRTSAMGIKTIRMLRRRCTFPTRCACWGPLRSRCASVLDPRRILIYTQPPVEAASFPCQVAADMCFEDQTTPTIPGEGATPQLKGKHKEGINVLGIVTPHDIDMLERVADRARLDSVYDRRDVPREATALRPGHRTNLICTYRASRDRATGLAARDRGVVPRKPTYRLSTICFTWSVVTLWSELDRILQLDADTNSVARAHRASSLGGLVGRVRGRMCRLREALLRLLAQRQRQWKQRIARPVWPGPGSNGPGAAVCVWRRHRRAPGVIPPARRRRRGKYDSKSSVTVTSVCAGALLSHAV
ncbi:hypothetical protein EDB84DRAFT_968373 [Lactarius hengduanensis]|nr:hypothetical protein EDB84DRAFT_968373 [Lactarius hengduanensis]